MLSEKMKWSLKHLAEAGDRGCMIAGSGGNIAKSTAFALCNRGLAQTAHSNSGRTWVVLTEAGKAMAREIAENGEK